MTERKCKNCEWWVTRTPMLEVDKHWGQCRKKSPSVGGTSERVYTAWPDTRENDFCGEFEEKAE